MLSNSSGVVRKICNRSDLIEAAKEATNASKRIRLNGLRPFRSLDDRATESGIPQRLNIIDGVDIQNLPDELPIYMEQHRKDVSYADFCHVDQYLSAKKFTFDILKDPSFDCIINAIVSYMLDWSDYKIEEFIKLFQKYTNLGESLIEFRNYEDGRYIYCYKSIPVVRTAVKIIKSLFVPKSINFDYFNWVRFIDYDFMVHIHDVYELLKSGKIMDRNTINLLEQDMDIPYILPNIDVSTLKNYNNPNCLKFITGEASCCKTTIGMKLSELGWKQYSRGDVGSFNRKPENRAAVGNLHAALHFVLTQPDVIGDRSFIDNVLWAFIMPACKPNTHIVDSLFSFLNANFNEPSVAEYITHKGVVFVDPSSFYNKQRQLNRCEDGDPWRGRLAMYADVQFISYYTIARLFGWKVICVPYTEDGSIDDVKYQENLESIIKFFGKPILTNIPYVKYQKPSNLYSFDYNFPKSVGIYK